jgi:hypothetical protein
MARLALAAPTVDWHWIWLVVAIGLSTAAWFFWTAR